MGITAPGKNTEEAREKAYKATELITFSNKYMRHDIAAANR
jgi:phosphoribosylamine--glycine ligase